MPTARPFAYNTGSTIPGTIQVGNLAVGDATSPTGNPPFWNGPDEELGYVIAVPVSGNTQPTPMSGVTASVGFFRTSSKSESLFITLSQYVASLYGNPQTFASGKDASTWLTTNGYWNSWVSTPILSGLVLYLDAIEPLSYPGGGPTWYDLSGNGNDVEMQNPGSITWYDEGIGYFRTDIGWFNRPNGNNMPQGNSLYTFSAWIQLGLTWGAQGIMSVGPFFQINEANALRTVTTNSFVNYWWGNDFAANSSLSPTTNWFNIVARDNGTNRSLWVNGVSIGTGTRNSHNVTNSDIQIAKTYANEYLNGNIAQALIYDRALSDTEIVDNFNTYKSRFGL